MEFKPESFERDLPRSQEFRAIKKNTKNLTSRILPIFFVGVIALSCLCFGGAWFLYRMYQTLPTLDQLENIEPPLSSKVMGKDGALVHEFSIEKRSWIPLKKVPQDFINAVIAIEDRKFFEHWGVDVKRIIGASLVNVVRGHYAQGGSTLTQQLARNVYLSSQTSMIRKVREAMTAVQIETYYSKKEILELYVNQVYLGAGVYGIDAAAHYYFNKPASKLNLNECSVLAGIIQLPERYRPDRKSNAPRIVARRGKVLQAMEKMNFIDAKTAQTISKAPVPWDPQKDVSKKAPYFVEHVRQYCEQKYGDDLLYNGGLTIYTTLDAEAQEAIEKGLAVQLKDLQGKMNGYFLDRTSFWKRHKIPHDFFLNHFDSMYAIYKDECEKFPDSLKLRTVQIALAAMEVKTGAVLALIGGRDFLESKFNRALQAVRQPGSSFKPFVYTAAIDHGFTPASELLDQPITLSTPQGDWHPENYDKTFKGAVTMRYALNHSLNMVAIRTLLEVGGDTVVNYARRMGLRQHLDAVPSLAIGSCEVIPFELLTAYAIFPNQGMKTTPYFVRRIVDREGKILEEHESPAPMPILTPQTAFIMCDMLASVVKNGTAAAIPGLGFDRPSAGKTGTSNDYSDAWFVGFTPQIVCCVWVGVDERRSLGWGLTGSLAAVPIYAKAMIALHKKLPVENFEKPEGVVSMKVCLASHKLAVSACPQTYNEFFLAGKLPESCDLHGAGKVKNANMMQMFGPQEKQEKKVPVKKRLSF